MQYINLKIFYTMSGSQQSYNTRIGRFHNVINLLKTLPEYQPTNSFITNDALDKFLSGTLSKNDEVIIQNNILKTKRDERRTLAFKDSLSQIDCVQACLDNIAHYVAGEFGTTNPAYKQIYTLKRKIKPSYPKKVVEPITKSTRTTRSSSEKSFSGLVSIAKHIIQIITSLGAAYAPQNASIQIPNFTQKVQHLDELNQAIALALQKYSEAVQTRKDLYDGAGGMKSRIMMIRNYMASFNGGRTNPHYIQVNTAIKGS